MKYLNLLIKQLDKTTAWVGIIGLTLLILGLHSVLFFLFILLVVAPEASLKDMFMKWTASIKEVEKDINK